MKRLIVYSLICLSFAFCKNQSTESTNVTGPIKATIDVNSKSISDCEGWDNLIADMDFIPLETNDSCLMDEIRKVAVCENRICVLSRNQGLFIFNTKGKLINHLTAKGKGPLELLRPIDFNLSKSGKLYVLDQYKIIEYDLNGNPISEANLNLQITQTRPINIYYHDSANIYTWYPAINTNTATNKYHLCVSDNHSSIKSKHIPFSHFTFGVEGRFSQSGKNEISIAPADLNDTIFIIKNGELLPGFIIDINNGKKKQIEPLIGNTSDDFQFFDQLNHYMLKHNLYSIGGNAVYNSTFLTFTISKPGEHFRCVYNYKTDDAYLLGCYENNANSAIFYPVSIYCSFNDAFYSSKNAYQLRKFLDEGKTGCTFLPEKRRLELLDKIKDVKETDNPVLMVIKTKNK
ncbi:MAG: 6-bladed beta-propeller [Lentimicrobiaceae bacterium]